MPIKKPSIRGANDLGLILVDREFASHPFCFYANANSLQVSIGECCHWAAEFIFAEGRLILLSDLDVDTGEREEKFQPLRDEDELDIHGALATAQKTDVLLVISARDSIKKVGALSDYAKLLRALKGLDLPGEFADQTEF